MKKFLAAALIVGNLFLSSTVDAEIKNYTATSKEVANKLETQEVVKLRALDKAIKLALTEAGDYLKKNSSLTAEEISAITSNSFELVGVPQYNNAGKSSTWSATIEIKIDDAELKNWLQRDAIEKITLIKQNRESEKISEANERRIEDLRSRAENMKKQDKKFFKSEFEYVNNEFLSNQKVETGDKFFYRGRFDDAIKLYTEALELNADNAVAYNRRGNIHNILAMNQRNVPVAESSRRQALSDFDKAIRLDNNYADAFTNRGFTYLNAKIFSTAIKDFNRAIQLNPNDAQNYVYRGLSYRQTDKNLALADFNKAVELAPNAAYVYLNRGNFYEQDLKDFAKATEDYSRAIEFETQKNSLPLYYNSRGGAYQKSSLYGKAIDDYTRAIDLIERADQKNPLLSWIYKKRGECYKAIGDGASAQADLKKFEDLQRR